MSQNTRLNNSSPKSNNNVDEEDFEKLLDTYGDTLGTQLNVGDRVKGRIITVGNDTVFIDTGSKIDGIVDKAELLDENGQITYQEGDELELFVVNANDDEIRLSKALSGRGNLDVLKDAFSKEVPVEGKVKETCKGGFVVDLLKHRAFCPISQVDLKYVDNTDDYIGETFPFLITRLEDNGRNIVVSRRTILQKEQQKAEMEFFQTLSEGDILNGRITRLMPYGAFVELIPGVEGMIHISELAWSRIEKPDEVVHPGDRVQVKVINIDDGPRPHAKKIALSIKQVSEDPWRQADEKYKEGDILKGKVKHCAAFGAFVEIAPGIEGLVHISEMSYRRRITKPEEVVNPGDTVNVMIKTLDVANRKISLSIRDAVGDPWQEVPDKYAVGQSLSGTIEKKERFGYFVSLEPGIQGLIPKSKITASTMSAQIEKLKTGSTISVTIANIDVEQRRISLTPADSVDASEWRQYADQSQQSLGALGEKLKAALASKKSSK